FDLACTAMIWDQSCGVPAARRAMLASQGLV
ncbi:MAG: hypothetical protein K0S88_4969, partial [Actinomycetia bacterium]|nr:hypothetical protein [Actinomycetes bacterium]